MGVIGIFRGMGKTFRVCRYAFIYLKTTSAPEDPITLLIRFLFWS